MRTTTKKMDIHVKKESVIYLTRRVPHLLTIYIKKQKIFITITLGEVKAAIRLQSFWPIKYHINEI
jgi:hypothetical protein